MNRESSTSSSGETDSEDYMWWARDVAKNLHAAVSENVSLGRRSGASEKANMTTLTRQIAREVASQIPKSALASLVNEARDKMKIVESSCLDQLHTPTHSSSDRSNAPYITSPTGERFQVGSTTADHEMAEVLTRGIPEEISKWMAKEIYSQLMATGSDSCSSDEDDDAEVDQVQWRTASVTFDYNPDGGKAKGSIAAAEMERTFYKVDDSKQRADAFKKFKMVLARGNGFRILKHNHNGGVKTRILKYNAVKNRISWESSRVLGGERIVCARIVKIHRENTIVYVWHITGGRHGSVKKMVGFETQREADARILELALLYLKDHGIYGKK